MTHSNISLKGQMTVSVLDQDGDVLRQAENHNRVLESGMKSLLNMLSGDWSSASMGLLLATKGFEPNDPNALENENVIKLVKAPKITKSIKDNVLNISFRGDAASEGTIIAGGIILNILTAKREEKISLLYNFAEIRGGLKVVKSAPILASFAVSVGG